ncbi:uncharacterized protein JCM10292_006216 [Rhodotorula paludigena]|uniref:uncharacterized protein n=1 Tax=Rhodotorula paludigena TaxID=86838 RepID=UPI003172563A
MVKLAVQIKATLEAVDNLKPVGEDFTFMFKVKCSSCREEHPNWVGVTPTETHEISGSRGEANLVWRCTLCKKENNINFDDSFKRASAAYTLDDSDNQRWGTLAVVECRGCEVVDFDPKGEWACVGAESGTKFDEVELSNDEPEWTDYDEKAGASVSVMELETRITRA